MTSLSTEEQLRLAVGALLARTGESQRDLGRALGLTQTQVSRKQSGKVSWSLSDCDRLAAHWSIPVPDLLSGPTHAAALLPEDRVAPGRRAGGGQQAVIPIPADPAAAAAAAMASATPIAAATAEPVQAPVAPVAEALPVPVPAWWEADRDPATGRAVQELPEPCVLCGQLTPYRGGGRPQHLGGLCPSPAAAPAAAEPVVEPAAPAPPTPTLARRSSAGAGAGGLEELQGRVRATVAAVMEEHEDDVDAAAAVLLKRAVPDVMMLFNASRVGGRYEHSDFPPTADILKKRSQKGADEIWEGRPKWRNTPALTAAKKAGPVEVAALDMNAAFLSALKTYLPIGRLEPDTTGIHNRRRAGVHRITPPAWEHTDLPNPLGARQEPGPLWVTEPTLRLLLDAARLDLCDTPVIHESLTSGATESLLEKLRRALVAARKEYIDTDDELALAYVKSMYSKFVSTIGESSTNRAIRRPDWVHIIRSQAFANLWRKAHKAHTAGLTVMEMSGTDELHVAGDWQQVFAEGRSPSEVKLKHAYTLGTIGEGR